MWYELRAIYTRSNVQLFFISHTYVQLDDFLLASVERLSSEDQAHFWSLADAKSPGGEKTARSESKA
jgi:hypothetical protein